MAKVAAQAGIRLIEITWNSNRAENLITDLRQELPDCVIGTGTVLDAAMLEGAIAAGAQFVFSPHVNPALIQASLEQGIPFIPGALTPTEIVTAWQAGAPCVKLFPVNAVGGIPYLRSLQGPLRHIPIIPTGGVTIENARSFLDVGAIAVGLSSNLFPSHLIETNQWDILERRVASLVAELSGDRRTVSLGSSHSLPEDSRIPDSRIPDSRIPDNRCDPGIGHETRKNPVTGYDAIENIALS
jgi:2-dehydro-3-deoxyphosphogluconate aldolase/(4S)-4-hydroxy-2-oxoglutarate aldolase